MMRIILSKIASYSLKGAGAVFALSVSLLDIGGTSCAGIAVATLIGAAAVLTGTWPLA